MDTLLGSLVYLLALPWVEFLLEVADACLIPHKIQKKKSLKKSKCSQSIHIVFVEEEIDSGIEEKVK